MNTIIHKSCSHIKNYTVIMFKEKRKNLANLQYLIYTRICLSDKKEYKQEKN